MSAHWHLLLNLCHIMSRLVAIVFLSVHIGECELALDPNVQFFYWTASHVMETFCAYAEKKCRFWEWVWKQSTNNSSLWKSHSGSNFVCQMSWNNQCGALFLNHKHLFSDYSLGHSKAFKCFCILLEILTKWVHCDTTFFSHERIYQNSVVIK